MTLKSDHAESPLLPDSVSSDLADALQPHGFKDVPEASPALSGGVQRLLKRQNWNTNRAVVVASVLERPQELGAYIRQLREIVAKRCGYLPVLWPIGIQVVIGTPGALQVDPAPYLALVDNQWALIQSVFLVDPQRSEYREARTWGQYVTGKFQDAISTVLARHFRRYAPDGMERSRV